MQFEGLIENRCCERNDRIFNQQLSPALRVEVILFAGAQLIMHDDRWRLCVWRRLSVKN
jgi:hypothetical protein